MSDIFVPPNDREVFERQFIEVHPALGLKATSNSGAYWGDGDARPQAKREEGLTFAVEMKTGKDRPLRPKASEYAKAFGEPTGSAGNGQLGKFDSRAIRMIAVFSLAEETYAVSMPQEDYRRLSAEVGAPAEPEEKTLRRGGKQVAYCHFPWLEWKALYERIEQNN